jgi:hypothetical protein
MFTSARIRHQTQKNKKEEKLYVENKGKEKMGNHSE